MSITSVLLSLHRDDAVVAGSERLARELRIQLDLLKSATGATVWEAGTPILSFQSWVTRSWEGLWPEEQLLHGVQELQLYKTAIDRSPEAGRFISTTAAARLAQKAGRLMVSHCIPRDRSDFALDPEAEAFSGWLGTVEGMLSERQWTTQDRLLEALIGALDEGRWSPPRRLFLIGFVEMDPLQQRLVDALQAAGCGVSFIDTSEDRQAIPVFSRPSDPDAELRSAAEWARDCLASYIDTPADAPRLALLVPDVTAIRSRLEAVFREVLAPQAMLPAAGASGETGEGATHRLPWVFGYGQPLGEYPIINGAMTGLGLSLHGNEAGLVTRALLNRYLGEHSQDQYSRARLDVRLRESCGRSVSLDQVLHFGRKDADAGRFCARLDRLVEMLNTETSEYPSAWADRFSDRLQALGWPGDRPLNSDDYQALRAWRDALDVFRSLDGQLGQVSGERAYMWLREILATRPFQPKRPYHAPIQVLGLWDAVGMQFDKAYVIGLDASALPEAASPNPFIPLHLQRAAGVPGASPERALEVALKLVRQLTAIAPEIVLSCPVRDGEGSLISPSPLFEGWPDSATTDTAYEPTVVAHILSEGPALSVPDEDDFPEVDDAELARLRGGVSILTDYLASPFYAAARTRLQLRPFPLPAAGLGASVQGDVVHAALDRFWRRTKTSSALQALSGDALQAEILASLDEALADKPLLPIARYGARLVSLERARVAELLTTWLEYEKQRTYPFEAVAIESELEGMVGRLRVKIRLDRVDRIDDSDGAHYLLLDYKTGATVRPEGWNVDQFTQPQLPTYAVFAGFEAIGLPQPDGIGYAHVRNTPKTHLRAAWEGPLVADETKRRSSKSIPMSWSEQLSAWEYELLQASEAFLAGNSQYDFAQHDRSGLYGDLQHLLRVGDRALPSA